ncbi:MAG: ion transporter, partial [Gemmatimonadaceae bacterium]|nr:ion transporter [Gemmatimonadaceae bacterium]
QGVNEAVSSPLDALWWGVTTMTTVGYGDVYPITPEGRVAAAVLMILGISLFGVVTATATGLIIRGSGDAEQELNPVAQIERLFALHKAGALTDDEYSSTKAELLGGL